MNDRLLLLMASLLVAASAAAATVRVPLDQPDLPAALAAAADGDTIRLAASHVVAGGTVLPGRALVILGGWDDAFTTRIGRTGVAAGVDDSSLRLEAPGSGSLELTGFSIAAGPGQARTSPLPGRYGGGLLVEGGAPVLSDLEISGGNVGSGGLGCGGALALIDTDAEVTASAFMQNTATWGGAIFVQGGAPVLSDLTVTGNACGPDAAGQLAQGAGILVRQSNAAIERCLVRGGRDAVNGGGVAWLGGRGLTLTLTDCEISDNTMARDGGGLYGDGGTVIVTGGLLADNVPAPGAEFTSGGGAYLTGARVSVVGAVFRDNSAAAGGGLTVNTGAEVDVLDCVFLGNQAAQFGAGLNYQSNDTGAIAGNTLAGNQNPDGAGVLNLVNTSPTLARNLVAFNQGGGVRVTGGSVVPTCNDVVGNTGTAWNGLADPTGQDGNLATDPLFCDLAAGDLTLRDDSPCLAPPGCDGRIGALGEGCAVGVGAPLPQVAARVTAFPNPANPAVTIRCTLPRDDRLEVTLHDVRGRLVRRLADRDAPAGTHDLRWDGRDDQGRALASGAYIYRLAGRDGVLASGRVALLR